jgi:hypothetical protein
MIIIAKLLKKFPPVREHQDSFPCSQETANGIRLRNVSLLFLWLNPQVGGSPLAAVHDGEAVSSISN